MLFDEASVDGAARAAAIQEPLVLSIFVPATGFKTMSTKKLFLELLGYEQ